ncbi:N-acetylmuramoyl-L-alanine amidase [Deinococcus sp.]|uniref:N-acetylmuramoyl-L-alanine amidase family protein n=1 Tax=Deinococcus sp. TaxID=47478 RepID=UPI0025BC9049|nr:N-acetylmuramoyl-L-alanine amidase [Deinococcus sp.]
MFPVSRLRHLALTLLAASLSAAPSTALAAPSVFVAYPAPDYRVAYDHIILEGSVTPGASLQISGQPAEVAPDGLFMLWWPLKVGLNNLQLVATQGSETGRFELRVTRTAQRALPARPTFISTSSIEPHYDTEFWDIAGDSAAERTITVSFSGSRGGKASVQVAGGAPVALQEGPAGTYTGQVVVPPQSSLSSAPIRVRLTGQDGRTLRTTAAGHISSVSASPRTGTQKAGTIRGLGLNDAQYVGTDLDGNALLYPRSGMVFTLVGRQGSDVRARLAPGQSLLLTASQLEITPGRPALAASGPIRLESGTGAATATLLAPVGSALQASAVNLTTIPSTPPGQSGPEKSGPQSATVPQPMTAQPVTAQPAQAVTVSTAAGDLQLHIPLGGAKPPFQIDQTAPGQLTITLYGLSTPPTAPTQGDALIHSVGTVPGNGLSRVVLDLNTAQLWGYTANYVGGDLLVTVRRPPAPSPAQPLAGRVITIDPGHGGSQSGGAGSFGIPEKGLVLKIATRVAELLRAQGATINMTRTGDTTLGLYERDLSAEATGSDLLVSIHANALPDGRDPRGVRGPEVHFSHMQAQAVANAILDQLRSRLPDIGTGRGLMPGANLALTRPTTQISLLVETAYLTDPGNLRVLNSSEGQERFAQAIAAGISDFYVSQRR